MDAINNLKSIATQTLILSTLVYFAYFISKTYQIGRLLELSKRFSLNGEQLSLLHCVLNTLPLLFHSDTRTNNNFGENFSIISGANMLNITLFLSFLIYLSGGVFKIQYIVFLRSIAFSFMVEVLSCIIILSESTSWLFFTALSYFLLHYFAVFLLNGQVLLEFDDSVAVEITDYAGPMTIFFYAMEKRLKKAMNLICGEAKAYEGKEEKSIFMLSLPILVILYFLICPEIFDFNLLAVCFAASFIFNLFLTYATKRGKNQLLIKSYGYFSSTFMIYLISMLCNSLIKHWHSDSTLTPISNIFLRAAALNIGLFVSIPSFMMRKQNAICGYAVFTGLIPVFLINLLVHSYEPGSAVDNIQKINVDMNEKMPFVYAIVIYAILIFNYETLRHSFKVVTSGVLVLNFLLYLFCCVAKIVDKN